MSKWTVNTEEAKNITILNETKNKLELYSKEIVTIKYLINAYNQIYG